MKFWDELDYDYETMYEDKTPQNNEKRNFMYRSFIRGKYGSLGRGIRKSTKVLCNIYLRDVSTAGGTTSDGAL